MKTMIFCACMLCLLLALVGCSAPWQPAPAPTVIIVMPTPTAHVPTPTPHQVPLVPQGTQVPSHLGAFFLYRGTIYTIDPGKGGRIWGVLGKVSRTQAESTPVGPKKVLLIAPARYYSRESPSA